MELSERDRKVAAALPFLAVLLIYGLRWGAPTERANRAMSVELARQDSAESRRARLAQLNREVGELSVELAEVNERNTGEGAIVRMGRRRMGTLRSVAQLCEVAGVGMLEAVPDETATAGSAATSGLAGKLEKAGWEEPQWWSLRLRGGYPAVQKVVEGIARENLSALPTRLGMEPVGDDSLPPSWVLGLWL